MKFYTRCFSRLAKRSTSLFLSLAFFALLALFPVNSASAEDLFVNVLPPQPPVVQTLGDWVYADNGESITITKYTGAAQTVWIPSAIYGKPVTIIGDGAFRERYILNVVIIPNSVSYIGQDAFRDCFDLISVYFNSVVPPVVGPFAFFGVNPSARAYYPPGATAGILGTSWEGLTLDLYTVPPTPSNAVSFIDGVTTVVVAGNVLVLSGTAQPLTASNRRIIWSLVSAGTTGATLVGNTLYTRAMGSAVVRATIINGVQAGMDYIQDFTITVAGGWSGDPSAWAAYGVGEAAGLSLVPSYLLSNFLQPVTRTEFCALAVRLYENVTSRQIAFDFVEVIGSSDINVRKAAAIGVLNGVAVDSEGAIVFNPDMQFTREQAAVMIDRLATAIGRPLPAHAPAFADNGSISPWARTEAGRVQAAGIMNGVGNNLFAPLDMYTREQSIVSLLRLYKW